MSNRFGRLVVSGMLVGLWAQAGYGYLRIHPNNPHYFQETTTGKPVLVSTVTALVPSTYSIDYIAVTNFNSSWRIGYSRVWHLLPWETSNAIWPWARSSTPGAYMGGNKFDFNTWNTTYWDRLKDNLNRANNQGGILAEIHLFDRCGMSPAAWERWANNPWASDNNINNLEVPGGADDGTPDFYYYASKPNLRNQQERYIRKMIDETIAYNNVFYEIENEHWQHDDPDWASHYGQFVKNYIAANYPSSPRLVSYNSLEDDLEDMYTISAIDIVNRHYGNDLENDPSIVNPYLNDRWGYNKPINIDEFANGLTDPDVLREICWTIVTSGGHFHIEDADNAALPYNIVENIRSFKEMSGWNFVAAGPSDNLIVSGGGYCMAALGYEYVCYFPSGGSKTLNLQAGNYTAKWWNPSTGGFYNVSSFSHGGGNRGFSTPNGNDWVLLVSTQATPTTVVDSKPAGTITVDGNSGDWNLAEFTTKMTAGTVGTGDIAVIGYDTNLVCYQGNHAGGTQYPPDEPADFAVKVYSRNNASYLYFLVRIDDDDLRYPNPVDSNWANDCIEFYIDPGNNGGATSISNSTSDIQLVIDANNQKNVYMCTSGYAAQVLAGVTSAVVRDAAGWTLEARIAKSALDPDIPASGTIGIEFNFRDNDNNNDSAVTSVVSWLDSSGDGFPSKVPDRWGDLNLQQTVGPPGQASNPSPVAGATNVPISTDLSWTAGSGATSHDVYFGTTSPGTFRGNQAGTTYDPGTLALSTSYYWRIDEKNASGTTTGTVWSFTTAASSVSVPTLNVKAAGTLTVDGSSSDWNLGEFTTKVHGGEIVQGDIGWVGWDGANLYYAAYAGVLPTSAADHTAKIYSRHDGAYQYFLLRLDDSDRRTPYAADTNWANDCVEFYIDPGHDHGSSSMSNSTSDIQLVIDAANQKNVYMCTEAYRSQVLAGVTSAVTTDSSGWWLEVRITKSALDPDMPAAGSFGVDFNFRDNDNNNDPALTTIYTWAETSTQGFPSKIPSHWGDVVLGTLPAPGQASNPSPASGATGVALSPTLTWTAGSYATSHDVRFGTANPPPFIQNQTSTSYSPGLLSPSTTYYWRIDEKNGSGTTTGVVWSFTTTNQTVTVPTIDVKAAGTITIDGNTSDWVLGDFTTKVHGGEIVQGDIAWVGWDGGTYYAAYWLPSFSQPTNAADHTARVYSRHDGAYQYFLVRVDDSQMNYAQPVETNWANDCVEFYIDPGYDGGASPMNNSTSDIQLVIDCNNQKNVYMCTTGYAAQVLAGVTSAVVRDATGYWMEVRIAKSALDPDMPSTAAFGVDFCFRDNDDPNQTYPYGAPASSTMASWSDSNPGGGSFPTKIPDHWGDALLAALPAPGQASSPNPASGATGVNTNADLSWTPGSYATSHDVYFGTANPPPFVQNQTAATCDPGTMSASTTYYWRIDEKNGAGTTTGVVWSFTTSAAAPTTFFTSPFNSSSDGWTIVVWKAGQYANGTMAFDSGTGNPAGSMKSTGSGATDNDSSCTREGGEINKVVSTAGYSAIRLDYDVRFDTNQTGAGCSGGCTPLEGDCADKLAAYYSTTGAIGPWYLLEQVYADTLTQGAFYTRQINLPPGANNNASFALRFRFQFNTASDTGRLDNIKLTGTP